METKRFSLVKPTLQTPFHIDFTWWKHNDNNWRVYLISCLCSEHQESLKNSDIDTMIDWVDPETAEIQQVDGLQHILINHCAKLDGFVTNHTSLVDAVFRTLLANGNTPLSPEELSSRLGRPSMTILLTLTGLQVYKGLRPVPRVN
jgi:hypothetical protein